MLTFLFLNGGAVLLALVVATAVEPRGRILLATLCGYVIAVHSLILLTGLAGRLTVSGVTIALGAAVGVALVAAFRLARARGDDIGARKATGLTPIVLFPVVAALAAGVVWAWPHLFEATRLWVWDDYTYHMVYPALWLHEHAIGAATPAQAFTMQAWYPLSASVVATWFMLPFQPVRGEALAWVSLTGVLYGGIVAIGAAELLARLGCRRVAWAVPVVIFATSHRMAVMASSFSDADLAQAALMFAAFVFAIPRDTVESARAVRADSWYAALLSGIALGVKVSAAPSALVVLTLLALRAAAARCGARMRALATTGLVFAGSWAVTGGYWYARNLVHTGNPVYPAAFLVWPGATFPETTLREYARQYGPQRAVADALVVYMDWPRLHAALAVLGLMGLAGWLALRWRLQTRPQRYFACGALAIVAVVLLLLPGAPYSAGNAMTFRSGFIHWDSMRYVAVVPLLGWTALGYLTASGSGPWRLIASGAAVVISASALLASGNALLASPFALIALALCAAGLGNAGLDLGRRLPRVIHRDALAAGAVAVVLAVIVACSHAAKSAATGEAFYRERLIGAAARVLAPDPAGTRVAVFGDQWIYPAFGARDHLQPVRLDGDGRVATAPIADGMEPGDLTVDPLTFRANLAASGVGLVVMVHQPHPGRSSQWPAQQAALDATGDAQSLYRDGAVGIWRLGATRTGGITAP
jgi:hypothetical protein